MIWYCIRHNCLCKIRLLFILFIFFIFRVDKEDEMYCLIKGTNFLLRNVAKEAFIFQRNGDHPNYVFQNLDSNLHPYILVNIGSGVSIIKVTGEESYERIGRLSTGRYFLIFYLAFYETGSVYQISFLFKKDEWP